MNRSTVSKNSWAPRTRDPGGTGDRTKDIPRWKAIRKARRQYFEAQRVQGLSDPADEQMRGYGEAPAGRKRGVDIGSDL